jgi:hypothetical protein
VSQKGRDLPFSIESKGRDLMPNQRLQRASWVGGLVLGLVSLALAGCGSANASSTQASPTATCPPTQAQQFSQVTGTITAVSSTQVTIQNLQGTAVTLQLASQTRYSRQQTASLSDVQDGKTIQIIAKQNTDGSYTAQTVVIQNRAVGNGNGGFGGGGSGGNGGNGGTGGRGSGGNRACFPRGTFTPGAGGFGGGQGNLPNGERLVAGTVSTVSGQSITVTTRAGQDLTINVDNATAYSTTAQAQASDLQKGQAVLAQGRKNSDGTITAAAITILLKLPTGNTNP